LIFICNSYRPNQPIYAIRAGASGDISLKDGVTSNEYVAWSMQRGGTYMPTPIIYGDYLYTCANHGVMTCYNARSGERVYQQRIGDKGGSYSASPVAADGKVYLSSEDGEVFVVKAGPKYELLATNTMGEVLMATPAISDGMIFVRGQHNLFAIGEPAAKSKASK
jgi:outer membrane protein assembly factor BamB